MIAITIKIINWSVLTLMLLCFGYQILFFFSRYFNPKQNKEQPQHHNYGVLIAARNEAAVIGDLILSLRKQSYHSGSIQIFVVADNCTDQTATIARQYGATVFERNDTANIGKGYALSFLIHKLTIQGLLNQFDGFFIFDADNLLEPDYIEQMNHTFSQGYPVVTSYRNSKNFGANWISYSYGLWFLHDSQFLNRGRSCCNTSCMVNGTGYLISREVITHNNGWNWFLLTEDIEFTANCILNDISIGYCQKAVFYDEQPIHFRDSWKQRKRWIRGYYQVLEKYGKNLVKKCIHQKSFSSFDMIMANLPMFLIVSLNILAFGIIFLLACFTGHDILYVLRWIGILLAETYAVLLALGSYTLCSEWKHIHVNLFKKISFLFLFPLFMYSYFFVALAAMDKSTTWEPIQHISLSLSPTKKPAA